MSVTAQSHVWKYAKAKGSALLVLLAIADYAHDDGMNAWPTMPGLAEKTRMSERGVRIILRQLEESGELRIRDNDAKTEVRGGYVPRRFMDVLCVPTSVKKACTGKDCPPIEKPIESAPENAPNFRHQENISPTTPPAEFSGEENTAPGRILHERGNKSVTDPEGSGTAYKEDPLRIRQEIRQGESEAPPAPLFAELTLRTPAQLVACWNTHREPGPKVNRLLTQPRLRAYTRALKEHPLQSDWDTAVIWLNAQPWANAKGTGDYPNWRATLDWLAKPGQLAQILEQAATDRLAPTTQPRRPGDLPDRTPQDAVARDERLRRSQDYQQRQAELDAEAEALVLELPDAARAQLEAHVLVDLEPWRARMAPATFDDTVMKALPSELIKLAHGRPLTDAVKELHQPAGARA